MTDLREDQPDLPPPVRLLHISDVHLGSDTRWDAHLAEFAEFTRWAGQLSPDLIVIAGDLFDSNRVRGTLVQRVLALLEPLPPVVIVPGNHDALDQTSVYHRPEWGQRSPEIHVLTRVGGEAVSIPSLKTTVWGCPTETHSPAFRPLAGLPEVDAPGWHIAVVHGEYVEKAPTLVGSPIFPDDLQRPDWDYMALGHRPIFHRIQAHPVACYSGNLVHFDGEHLQGIVVTLAPQQMVRAERVAYRL